MIFFSYVTCTHDSLIAQRITVLTDNIDSILFGEKNPCGIQNFELQAAGLTDFLLIDVTLKKRLMGHIAHLKNSSNNKHVRLYYNAD